MTEASPLLVLVEETLATGHEHTYGSTLPSDTITNPVSKPENRVLRRCTWQQAAANTFLYMYGAGTVPYAIGQMGLTWSIIFMTLFTVTSFVSGHLLIEICCRGHAYSYPAVGHLAFGTVGAQFVNALQVHCTCCIPHHTAASPATSHCCTSLHYITPTSWHAPPHKRNHVTPTKYELRPLHAFIILVATSSHRAALFLLAELDHV